MSGFNWSKLANKSKLYRENTQKQKVAEQARIQKMLNDDTAPASEKQKEYIRGIISRTDFKMSNEEVDALTINLAKRIIGEYEAHTPATQKQKEKIKKNKLLIESKINTITIKEAKNIIFKASKLKQNKNYS